MNVTLAQLPGLIGLDLGESEWVEITQERISGFAHNTGDEQWIHTAPERCERESPFGKAVAHGYLTLSLISGLWKQLVVVDGASVAINYGLNTVRFPAPVTVCSRVRLGASVKSVDSIETGFQVVIDAVMECDTTTKPVCVAEPVFRYYT
jgi:acyl dehydratase